MASPAKQYDVVGTGRSFVDIIAHVPYDFMERFNLPLELGSFPETSVFREVQKNITPETRAPGGNISNTMAGLVALGCSTGFFSKTANDDTGHFFQKDLTERSIDDLCKNPVMNGDISGTCLVLLTPGGERSFVLHIGCSDDYVPDDFTSFDFRNAKTLLIDANQLSNANSLAQVDALATGIKHAAACGTRIFVSMSVVRSWQGRESYLHDILIKHADAIIGNETENNVMYGYTGTLADTDKLIITTMGERGSTARRGQQEYHAPAIMTDKFTSSLGAGDQFLAGFMKAEFMGLPVDKCLEAGARCAHAIIQETEARPAVGTSWDHLL